MDVHDTPDISRSLPLQPGMVITIEPGKKIRSQWWTKTCNTEDNRIPFSSGFVPQTKAFRSFLVTLKKIAVLENLKLFPCQSHCGVRKRYFPPKHSQGNKVWE